MAKRTRRKLRVVFAAAEAAPFVKTGGLGDVAGSLPQALVQAGCKVVVMLPKYGTIPQRYVDQMQHLTSFNVVVGWRNEYCGLEQLEMNGVTYLFIDNERYFKRSYPYGFFDDGERFAFFSKAITESLQHIPDFECDILHVNDWHTAMAPVFLREFYQGLPLYENVKTVFSIHNIAFQGQFSDTVIDDVCGLGDIPAAVDQLSCDRDAMNFMLGALNYTDSITTVSPSYAEEIKTPEYGEHLDLVLRKRAPILCGIVNGIDTEKYNPATDPAITANFGRENLAGKAACKAALQEELGLEVATERPLAVMISRLTRQKGIDLLTYSLDRLLQNGVQVAVLGTGDATYEDSMRYFAWKYPGKMAARLTFDAALSQRMYAGADMLLMPSLFEPCGLSQLIAMRYGTLPIVRETGGLKDTVTPYNKETGEGTGFSFAHFNGDELGDAVFRAARLFWDEPEAWHNVVVQAMSQDFSWAKSCETYLDIYYGLHPEVIPYIKRKQPGAEDEQPKPKKKKAASTTKTKKAAKAGKTKTAKVKKAKQAPKSKETTEAGAKATKAATAAAEQATEARTAPAAEKAAEPTTDSVSAAAAEPAPVSEAPAAPTKVSAAPETTTTKASSSTNEDEAKPTSNA